jgi:chorismate mutase
VNRRFQELRAEIAANDRRIVEAVNERLRLVSELWQLKSELGLERFDRDRERELVTELERANGGPLSQKALERLVGTLLDLTKQELGGQD